MKKSSYEFELLQVQPVATKSREFYKLSIKNNVTGTIEKIILHNPNIRKYCKLHNISLVKYENQYDYNDVSYEEYRGLLGIVDSYVVMDDYKFKANSIN